MPWRQVKDVMEQRVEFVIRARQAVGSMSALCREFGISRKCGYTWLHRLQEAGSLRALQERSRRPQHSPGRTPPSLEGLVVAARREFGWGARKIKVHLAEQGVALEEWTIQRILKRQGLVGARRIEGKATGRFERAEPNQLHQLDFKGEYRIRGGWCYPLSLLDDHSRYLVGLWALASQRTEPVQQALEAVFGQGGVPEALLLDRGVPWWSQSSGHGLTRLSVWLLDQEIALIYGAPRHPQTRGKVERFHRTLKERTAHQGLPPTLEAWRAWAGLFRREYNEVRPHEALGMRKPAECYSGLNLRPYRRRPAEYDYGSAKTGRIDAGGFLSLRGKRYFVCEALAGRRVRVEALDPLLVIFYRTTAIREIHLATGHSIALVRPATSPEVLPMSC